MPFDIARRARLKLAQIDAARSLGDLRIPPGNRLEALAGDRAGEHSVRVNGQWRLRFIWRAGNALGVELMNCL